MVAMAKKSPGGGKAGEAKRKRDVVYISLDPAVESALQKFLDSHRVKPERSAVGYSALVEFLTKCGFPPAVSKD